MGRLVRRDQGFEAQLEQRSVLGRSRAADLRLDDARVSGEHPVIVWSIEGWMLRDPGSRNGTFVDGERVPSGVALLLREGAVVGFGRSDGLEFVGGEEPAPVITSGGRTHPIEIKWRPRKRRDPLVPAVVRAVDEALRGHDAEAAIEREFPDQAALGKQPQRVVQRGLRDPGAAQIQGLVAAYHPLTK